mmetsp:Transcript_5932/g.24041  ORF Transcript_5932/g.24041 Transcript_5932/m.24041 type:complete len:218 (-) Transcript_5932:21-674(-)
MPATTLVWNLQSTSSLFPPSGLISEGEVTGTHSASTSSSSVAKVMAKLLSSTGLPVGLSNCTMSTTSNMLACTSRCLEHAASLSASRGFIHPARSELSTMTPSSETSTPPPQKSISQMDKPWMGFSFANRGPKFTTPAAFRPTPSVASDAKNANEKSRKHGFCRRTGWWYHANSPLPSTSTSSPSARLPYAPWPGEPLPDIFATATGTAAPVVRSIT